MGSSLYCLHEAPLKLCVDASLGGHIVEFSSAGDNALATSGPEVGSTFWPSPQQAWGWPPPNTLDKALYSVTRRGASLELLSAVCERTGLQLKKVFTLEPERLQVEYTMINASEEPLSYAPWEITRIRGGLTFYQSAEPPLAQSSGSAAIMGGCIWHHYRPEAQQQNEKLFGNGSSGWLANAHEGLLLIKKFEPVPASAVAPGEAEIEVYGHGDPQQPYIEIEQQGRYQSLLPKEELRWGVTWYLAKLPEHVNIEVGNPQLSQMVNAVLAGPPG